MPVVGRAQVLFFTDLESGPNRGGQDDAGAFVTIYGRGFGASREGSRVTIGGAQAFAYPTWTDTRITFQLGPSARSGPLVVSTARGASNRLPFTVRPGRIFFVARRGSDAADGSFSRPWATVIRAKDTMNPGDITYLMDGVAQAGEENAGAAVVIERGGQRGLPLALIAYPGARATIGSTALEYGVRVLTNEGSVVGDWVLAGLVLRGRMTAAEIGGFGSERWRIVGNDLSCPTGDGQTGCFAAALASHVAFLGNHVHDAGTKAVPQPSKQYHAVYFTTDTHHVEVGWNHIHDNATCRAIQFHSSPLCIPDCGPGDTTGFNQHTISIHDNRIHGDACDGINLATVDPSRGPVRVFNNLIFDVGRGPAPPDGDATYAGIYVAGSTNNGPDGTGVVQVFNNTLYDCGARVFRPDSVGDEGAFARGPGSPGLYLELINNLVLQRPGEHYLAPSALAARVRGRNNLWHGAGPAPALLATNVTADPRFADPARPDFHLTPASPAIDAGANVTLGHDFDGNQRPQGSRWDIGAFEFPASPETIPGPAAGGAPTPPRPASPATAPGR